VKMRFLSFYSYGQGTDPSFEICTGIFHYRTRHFLWLSHVQRCGFSEASRTICAIFIVFIVTCFLGLLIYYVPSVLKELKLSAARYYARIMTDELPSKDIRER
jgi:hypothetical protein